MIANTERGTKPSTDLPRIPPGGASNPSSKRRRIILAALAFIGFCVAGYLALYQLGLFSTVWEPCFGQGSHKILDSSLSRALPVPDAALGAAVYLADTLLTLSGDAERWRSKPWFALVA